LKTTTIRVTEQTKQRLAKLAKWGEPLEQVIIELLNQKKLREIHRDLGEFKDRLMSDAAQGKSYEAGQYACELDKILAKIEKELIENETNTK
jgi:hypothetical protein